LRIVDIMDLLNEVEERFPVDQWVIDGIHIWPLIRLDLASIMTNYFMFPSLYNKTNVVPLIIKIPKVLIRKASGNLKFVYAYFRDYQKNLRPYKADTIFLSDGISFSYIINSWYEKWSDPLIGKLRDNGISYFLISPLHEYFIPRHTPSMFIQPRLDRIRAKTTLFSGRAFKEESLDGFQDFFHLIESRELGMCFPGLAKIKSELLLVKKYGDFFSEVLEQVKPRSAFLVSYYNIVGMAFNLACRKLGIISVDIQHGVQGDLHWAYGRWKNVPGIGYELLPRIFWVWCDDDGDVIKRWSSKVPQWHRPLVGGNLFLDLWRSPGNHIVKHYDDRIEYAKGDQTNLIQILYTVGYEEMEKVRIILHVMKRTEGLCHWWLRIHPGKLRERDHFKRLLVETKVSNYEVDLATNFPLYALLRQMDLHLTFSSSSVIEAKDLGVPSVVFGDYGKELYSDLISSGWALAANTEEEIILAIKKQFGKREELRKLKGMGDKEEGDLDFIQSLKTAGLIP